MATIRPKTAHATGPPACSTFDFQVLKSVGLRRTLPPRGSAGRAPGVEQPPKREAARRRLITSHPDQREHQEQRASEVPPRQELPVTPLGRRSGARRGRTGSARPSASREVRNPLRVRVKRLARRQGGRSLSEDQFRVAASLLILRRVRRAPRNVSSSAVAMRSRRLPGPDPARPGRTRSPLRSPRHGRVSAAGVPSPPVGSTGRSRPRGRTTARGWPRRRGPAGASSSASERSRSESTTSASTSSAVGTCPLRWRAHAATKALRNSPSRAASMLIPAAAACPPNLVRCAAAGGQRLVEVEPEGRARGAPPLPRLNPIAIAGRANLSTRRAATMPTTPWCHPRPPPPAPAASSCAGGLRQRVHPDQLLNPLALGVLLLELGGQALGVGGVGAAADRARAAPLPDGRRR